MSAGVDTRAVARALAPVLRERADEIEEARRLPNDLSKRFAQSGFYRMCAPEKYGGLEQAPAITMETIERSHRPMALQPGSPSSARLQEPPSRSFPKRQHASYSQRPRQ